MSKHRVRRPLSSLRSATHLSVCSRSALMACFLSEQVNSYESLLRQQNGLIQIYTCEIIRLENDNEYRCVLNFSPVLVPVRLLPRLLRSPVWAPFLGLQLKFIYFNCAFKPHIHKDIEISLRSSDLHHPSHYLGAFWSLLENLTPPRLGISHFTGFLDLGNSVQCDETISPPFSSCPGA